MELLDKWMQAAADDDASILRAMHHDHAELLDCRHPDTDRTALQIAAAWDADRAVAFLLEQGASMYVTDGDGFSALHLATAADALVSLQLMLQYARSHLSVSATQGTALIDWRNQAGYTALLIAAEEGFVECTAALLKEGHADAALRLLGPPYATATDLALRQNHHAIVALLRENDASVCTAGKSDSDESSLLMHKQK